MVGIVAAASKLNCSGTRATEAIVVVTKLAKQAGAKASTRSPMAKPLTSRPRRTISPAHSMPMVAPAKPFSSASSGSVPHDPHHVTEIDACGVNANLNLAGRRRFAPRLGDEQIVQQTVGGELELERFRCRSPPSVHAQTMVSEPCLLGKGGRAQPIDVALGRREQNLAFGFSPDKLAGQ